MKPETRTFFKTELGVARFLMIRRVGICGDRRMLDILLLPILINYVMI